MFYYQLVNSVNSHKIVIAFENISLKYEVRVKEKIVQQICLYLYKKCTDR